MQTEPSEAPLSNRLREAFPKNEAFGPVTAYLRGMIHEAADRIDALELATHTDSRPDCSRCGKPIIMTASECDGCATRTDSPTDAALVTAIAALGHVSIRCMDRVESPLKPVGDIAREALQAIVKVLGDARYDALAARTDSPTDAVEAVAQALHAHDWVGPETVDHWEGLTFGEQSVYRRQARAALAAPPPSGEVERRALQEAVAMWNDLRHPFTEQAPKIYDVLCAALRNSSDGETK